MAGRNETQHYGVNEAEVALTSQHLAMEPAMATFREAVAPGCMQNRCNASDSVCFSPSPSRCLHVLLLRIALRQFLFPQSEVLGSSPGNPGTLVVPCLATKVNGIPLIFDPGKVQPAACKLRNIHEGVADLLLDGRHAFPCQRVAATHCTNPVARGEQFRRHGAIIPEFTTLS